MIPRKLKVKNFGAIPEAEFDFSGITLAAILGKNGRGKSTFFTWAALFALYGKSKPGLSIDDLVRKGQQDMLVQYEFEHQGGIYQATRTRSLKGKGKSTLEFQKLVDGHWESLSEAKISDTEKKIINLLLLDADTFIASNMILQNDASNFTKKLPGERKAILAQILGLEIYDRLQKAAKERERATNIKLSTSQNKIAELAIRIETIPDVQGQFEHVKQQATLNTINIREKETALSDIQAKIQYLNEKDREAKQTSKEITTIREYLEQIQTEADELDAKIAEADLILESEPLITKKAQELTELRGRLPALEEKVNRLTELEAEETRLWDEVTGLGKEEDGLDTRIADLEFDLSLAEPLKKDAEKYPERLAELTELDSKAEKHRHFAERLNFADMDLLSASSELDGLLNQYDQLLKKVAILADSGCLDSAIANCRFLKDAQNAQAQAPALKDQIEQAREGLTPLNENKQAILKELEAIAYDSTYHADLKKRTEHCRKASEKYATLSGKEELLQTVKGQREALGKRITDLNNQVLKIQSDKESLEADALNMITIKAQIAKLEPYEVQAQELPNAKANREAARQRLVKLTDDKTAKEKSLTDFKDKLNALNEGLQDALSTAKSEQDTTQLELNVLQSQAKSIYTRQGALQAQVDALLKDQEEHARLSLEMAPIAKELVRWQTLIKAFGRNGVPALIIENAIPELERISNDILSQMSNGAHSLRFETQRELKSRDGVAESLDIIVADWAGERPYESFSGGEQLRIDLAIRFALSELLANRAGSKVEWIVADEIFGSQDQEHRELVIESIKSIANRFKMALVISHITEALAAFDQQIIVGDNGKIEVLYN